MKKEMQELLNKVSTVTSNIGKIKDSLAVRFCCEYKEGEYCYSDYVASVPTEKLLKNELAFLWLVSFLDFNMDKEEAELLAKELEEVTNIDLVSRSSVAPHAFCDTGILGNYAFSYESITYYDNKGNPYSLTDLKFGTGTLTYEQIAFFNKYSGR